MTSPNIILLGKVSETSGDLSFIEKELPFEAKRMYWIYNTKSNSARGGHAHKNSDRVLVCLSGRVQIKLESCEGEKTNFVLDDASKALFFPKMHWVTMTCDQNSVLLAIVSSSYKDDIYIKDYNQFTNIK